MRWRSIDRAHDAVFENNKAGSDGECRMRQKRGVAMVGVALAGEDERVATEAGS